MSALVILNGPTIPKRLLNLLWPHDSPVICADGAANLLHEACPNFTPSYIVGDLDSIDPSVLAFYKSKAVKIVRDESVDENDFEKAMRIAGAQKSSAPVIVIGGHGGRFDQTLGNLNTMFKTAEAGRVITWLDVSNAITLLPKGTHHISINPSVEGPVCGLIPIGRAVQKVTTQGLRWNVDGPLSFGARALISTSNEVTHEIATITCSDPLVFTLQVRL